MSTTEKLVKKLLRRPLPENFSWRELETLLGRLGYEKREGSGSRARFIKLGDPASIIMLHKPHPDPNVDRGALKEVREELILRGEINE